MWNKDNWSNSCCSSEDGDEDILQSDLHDELYPGAPLTVYEFVTCVTALKVRYNLTKTSISAFLEFISWILPIGNKAPNTFYRHSKICSLVPTDLIKHFYCPGCMIAISNQNSACERCIQNHKKEYFLEKPILPQIQRLFQRPGFYEKLQLSYDDRQISLDNNNYSDVYHGALHKELVDAGFFSTPNDI